MDREDLEAIGRRLESEVGAGRGWVIDAELNAMLAAAPPGNAPSPGAPAPAAAAGALVAPASGPGAAARSGCASSEPEVRAAQGRSALDPATRAAELEDLRSRAVGCARCSLHEARTQVVFGTGNPDADLLFVGEAPGRDEDLQGEPFVGRAGQLLTRIIEAIQLERSAVYIANVLKCRPPENRNPNSAEITRCSPFLYEQIELVAPAVICALGRFACMTLLKTSSPLSRTRGRVHDFRGTPLVVTYHPAALLRYPKLKRPTWKDMQAVQAILAGTMPAPWAGSQRP